jgi:hypothetical protein
MRECDGENNEELDGKKGISIDRNALKMISYLLPSG